MTSLERKPTNQITEKTAKKNRRPYPEILLVRDHVIDRRAYITRDSPAGGNNYSGREGQSVSAETIPYTAVLLPCTAISLPCTDVLLPCTAVNIAVYVKKMNPYTALQMMGVNSGRVIRHAYWASIKHGGC